MGTSNLEKLNICLQNLRILSILSEGRICLKVECQRYWTEQQLTLCQVFHKIIDVRYYVLRLRKYLLCLHFKFDVAEIVSFEQYDQHFNIVREVYLLSCRNHFFRQQPG